MAQEFCKACDEAFTSGWICDSCGIGIVNHCPEHHFKVVHNSGFLKCPFCGPVYISDEGFECSACKNDKGGGVEKVEGACKECHKGICHELSDLKAAEPPKTP